VRFIYIVDSALQKLKDKNMTWWGDYYFRDQRLYDYYNYYVIYMYRI